MARRDRTTGLPRPRPRRDTRAQSKFAFAEQHQSLLLWVAGGLLLVVLLGLVIRAKVERSAPGEAEQ